MPTLNLTLLELPFPICEGQWIYGPALSLWSTNLHTQLIFNFCVIVTATEQVVPEFHRAIKDSQLITDSCALKLSQIF